MRLILISDTHSLHNKMLYNVEKLIDPNSTNILLHAGDITNVGSENDVRSFVYWYQNIKGFDTKIFIAGNHDLSFQGKPSWLSNYINEENLSQSDCVYLEDQELIFEDSELSRPIKIYGSPWQPLFYNWAFNLPRNGVEIEEKWKNIPDDTDILITHGPPKGIRDFTMSGDLVGCEKLYERLPHIKPLVHLFGHIHFAHGVSLFNDIMFVNASICDERYKPIQAPIVIDIKEVDGQILANNVEIKPN